MLRLLLVLLYSGMQTAVGRRWGCGVRSEEARRHGRAHGQVPGCEAIGGAAPTQASVLRGAAAYPSEEGLFSLQHASGRPLGAASCGGWRRRWRHRLHAPGRRAGGGVELDDEFRLQRRTTAAATAGPTVRGAQDRLHEAQRLLHLAGQPPQRQHRVPRLQVVHPGLLDARAVADVAHGVALGADEPSHDFPPDACLDLNDR
mmetsp:Transcript_14729/g.51623  ORF Transcript_14729/g.51623 Transcript_14729/m.51623 type:complete len:202 (-) Transcript_14729:655-1260(-)